METEIDELSEMVGIAIRYFLKLAFFDAFVETFNIFSLKGWMEGAHLVYYAAKGPDI
jgi:hypothetical protein